MGLELIYFVSRSLLPSEHSLTQPRHGLTTKTACNGLKLHFKLAKRIRIIRNTRKNDSVNSTLNLKAVTYMICLSKNELTVRVNIDALLGASLLTLEASNCQLTGNNKFSLLVVRLIDLLVFVYGDQPCLGQAPRRQITST